MELNEIRKKLFQEHKNVFAEFFATISGFKSRISNNSAYWDELDSVDKASVKHNHQWLKSWDLTEEKITELCTTLKVQSAKLKFRSDFIVVYGALLSLWSFALFPEYKWVVAIVMSGAFFDRFYVLQKNYENEVILEVLKSKV